MPRAKEKQDRYFGFSAFLSPFLEEALHEFGAFIGHDAGSDLGARVQGLGGKARVAAFFVGGSIDDAADLRPA